MRVFLLLLCLLSSLPLVWGQGEATSDAMANAAPNVAVLLWGLCLLCGSAATLASGFLPRKSWEGLWNVLVIEMGGMILVSGGALFYSYVLYELRSDLSGVLFAVGLTSAFGLACAWRVVQIVIRLRWIHRTVTGPS